MTKQTKILTGLLAGAALGAAIALVLSSDKSDDIKEKVSDWFCDLMNSSKDKLGSLSGLLNSKVSKVKV